MSRIVTSFAILVSFQFAFADAAKLCRVGAAFEKFDCDPKEVAERLAAGATLAKDPALCQASSGEKFAVIQLNPGGKTNFMVVRGQEQVQRLRKILNENGYSL